MVLLRGLDTNPQKRLETLINVMGRHRLEGSFITVRKDRIRIRRLPTNSQA